MRMLVIATDSGILQSLKPLVGWGHRVVVCPSLEVAVRTLTDAPFDLVLLRPAPPEALETLRAARAGEPPRWIALGAERAEGLPDGFLDFLPLPVSPERLREFAAKAAALVEPPPYNPQAALAICDQDPELLKDIVEVYLGDAPNQIQKMQTGFADGTLEPVKNAAHALKGASGNIAAGPVRAAAQELEWAAKEGRVTESQAAFRQVQYEFQRLKTRLAQDYPPA